MSTPARHLVVVGGGFAGFWACAAASRLRRKLGKTGAVRITLVSCHEQLVNRPMLYQDHPQDISAALAPPLQALGVELVIRQVSAVDTAARCLHCAEGAAPVAYDSLVVATGSRLARPDIPGLNEYGHDVDSLSSANAFWDALRCSQDGARVVVIGAGLTGLELVTEIASKKRFRTLLVDSRDQLSHSFAPEAATFVRSALIGTQTMVGSQVVAIGPHSVQLASGDSIAAEIVAWTAGMQADSLAGQLSCRTDSLGRVMTDRFLRVSPGVFAAGDVAHARIGETRTAPMSCQFAIPMGKTAGHNAMAELLQEPEQPFRYGRYVTCTDLGAGGALLTQGWDRTPVQTGAEAKATKAAILQMVMPPSDVEQIYAMALPDPG